MMVRSSRVVISLAIQIALGQSVTNGWADESPTVAYVTADRGPVRSGPGTQFYATDELVRGTEIEVHRRDPGGWLAIRPPDGSFCWVPESVLRATEDEDVAEIAKDTVVRVGSNLSEQDAPLDEEDVHHVRLKAGEAVVILGKEDRSDADGETARPWCRIAPPAGEFRWIHQDHTASDPPGPRDPDAENLEPQTTPIVPSAIPNASADTGLSPSDSETAESKIEETRSILLTANAEPVLEPPALVNVTDSFVPRQSATGPATAMPSAPLQAMPRPPVASAPVASGAGAFREISKTVVSATTPTRPAGWVDRELTGISVDLSLAVAGDPSTWNLDSLRRRTQSVIDAGNTPTTRDAARKLLAEIAQFEDLQRRHTRLGVRGAVGPLGPRSGSSPAAESEYPVATNGIPTGATPAEASANYNGRGYLMPVVAAQRGVPRYALTDAQGRILQFVVPAPGVNLRRYERQEVGVMGSQGPAPGLRPPLLTAERVVLLGRHR